MLLVFCIKDSIHYGEMVINTKLRNKFKLPQN